ncbi:MAG: hypothetical protein C5B59_03425 [Bacteroidetes bacterium]|nr:MAG: hypothetical protein C5B59_03425 [Bacteroidota bacterium]
MTTQTIRHKGPNLGLLAVIFAVLFCTGLSYVIAFRAGLPHYPGPWESSATIVQYFQGQPQNVLMCSFFHFCSAIPLGIFTATAVSRLGFLGSRAAGNNIALFGGFLTAFGVVISSLIGWVMAYPHIAADENVIRTLYYVAFAIGGVGYSVPLGLLIAGISVTSFFLKALPKWLCIFGILIALIGELSSLFMLVPKLIYLIPLTRFPGFIWLILAGFKLPSTVVRPSVVAKSLV